MIDKEIFDKTLKHIVEGSPKIISTGFTDFDMMLGAADYGSLITISGQNSMGKTAFLLNIMHRLITKQNKKCLLFSLQLGTELIIKRLLFIILEIPLCRFHIKESIKEDIERIKSTMEDLSKSDLTIFEDIIDTSVIESEIKKHKPEYVFIDSLELIHELNSENKQNIVNGVFAKLKDIAMKNNCIIINTCALPEAKQRKQKRPVLSDLREYGGADVVSDTVIFIYRDIYKKLNRRDNSRSTADLIFAKNKNAALSSISLYFEPKYGKFYNYEKADL